MNKFWSNLDLGIAKYFTIGAQAQREVRVYNIRMIIYI